MDDDQVDFSLRIQGIVPVLVKGLLQQQVSAPKIVRKDVVVDLVSKIR